MAKKKVKGPAKNTSTGWIVAVIVIVIIAALLFSKVGKETTTEVSKEEAAPEGMQKAAAPAMEPKCDGIAIGIVPGTKTVSGNVVTATFKNAARTALEGTYFEFSDGVNKIYRKNMQAVEAMGTIEYVVDLNEVAKELGSAVKTFVIYPMKDGKACSGARIYVIK